MAIVMVMLNVTMMMTDATMMMIIRGFVGSGLRRIGRGMVGVGETPVICRLALACNQST